MNTDEIIKICGIHEGMSDVEVLVKFHELRQSIRDYIKTLPVEEQISSLYKELEWAMEDEDDHAAMGLIDGIVKLLIEKIKHNYCL